MEQKFKKELKEREEAHQNMQNQLNNTIRRLEKENKSINERLELNSKNLASEAGGLEKKLERISDERDRLKEEFETVKAERDRKLDDLKRQFEREKEVLKQKNMDLQQKNKQTEAKQTELILSHETNRAKWDQEKSYLISAKEDAISELKNIQKRYENSVKEIERLKEQSKRNNWRMQNKERVG
jgi:chromosome segregation ATPase